MNSGFKCFGTAVHTNKIATNMALGKHPGGTPVSPGQSYKDIEVRQSTDGVSVSLSPPVLLRTPIIK